jgi:hypothetical protein
MKSVSLAASKVADPAYCAQKYDVAADNVLFVRLNENDYHATSFLDDRILTPGMEGFWLSRTVAAAPLSGRPLHFIFHTGHVGSTLLSRLMSSFPAVLPIREPLPLRSLADVYDMLETPHAPIDAGSFDERLQFFLRMWSRGFERTERVILKATSTAGRIASTLLGAQPQAKAVYLNVQAEPYIATLLAGANAMVDLKGHAPERSRRLERLLGETPLALHRATAGELAAMAWLAETLAQRAAEGPRVLMLDFERMLASLDETLATVAGHFGIAIPSAQTVAAIMGRYSKGPEHAYSPALRAQLLAQARSAHADELHKGLDWIQRSAKRYPVAARALGR